MPTNILAAAVVTTKMASGNVRFDVYSSADGLNSNGDLRFSFVLSSANVTAINTTVNGGSAGATLTQVLAENANSSDYLLGYQCNV